MDFRLEPDFVREKAGQKGCFGIYLFEVFSVRINEKKDVYGTFRVEDEKGTLDFYNKLPTDCQSVNPNSTLLSLTQTPRLIPAAGTITVSIDLKDKYGKEFVKGSFTLDFTDDNIGDVFDQYFETPIEGNMGSAFVYYTLPRVAVVSTIRIQLIKGDKGSGHSNVKGKIVARYEKDYGNCVDDKLKQFCMFTLYETTEDISLQLKDKDLLPLSRSCVVVPARRFIVIDMDLTFHHSDGRTDHLQASGIEALVCLYGAHRREFQLKHAALKLSVAAYM